MPTSTVSTLAVKDSTFYTQLRAEIETDPTAIGFAPLKASGSEAGIAALLNAVSPTILVIRIYIDFAYLMNAMVPALASISTAQAGQIQLLGLSGLVKLSDTATRTYLEGVYTTVNNKTLLQSQYTRPGSRAEFLWGDGMDITMNDLVIARGAGW